jgi:hypothetical protein
LRSERQSVVTEKSLASAPLMTTAGVARFHETLGGVGLWNGFVNVTVWAEVATPGVTVPKLTAVGDGVTS